jgi:glycosyltransferase involved in cell wall biosynthesis
MAGRKRVTLVVDEILGHVRTGGIGTATTFLAVALGRMGHDVELLYVGDRPEAPMAREWAELYDSAGVDIRLIDRGETRVEPSYFGRMRDVELALRAEPPDVVITQDLAAPAYTALRLRQLGSAFEETMFVVYCHGGRRWITDTACKVRVLPGAHAVTLLEQASVELCDVVVSPSAYLLDWMRAERWQLPQRALVIPYLNRSAATGEPQARTGTEGGRVERIAFFGRLEERKGLKPFAAGLNALSPELLHDVELQFVGAATPAWPQERIEGLLREQTKQALRRISFETDLDQPQALARLSRPGTLAVMPSLGETFSNAVYECLERGIPFIASDAGAPAELVAPEDRARVLFEPSGEGVAAALTRALSNGDALRAARPAFEAGTAYEQWARVIELEPEARPRAEAPPRVEVVLRSEAASALPASSSEWVILVDEEDVLDDDLLETLVRAQAASGADVVTCGIRLESGIERLFLGDPGGLGLLENHYGTVGLIRRSLLGDEVTEDPWALLARLTLEGVTIVSVPIALATSGKHPGDLVRDPSAALAVVQRFEQHLPWELRSLARLTAGLAASPAPGVAPRRSLLRRLVHR